VSVAELSGILIASVGVYLALSSPAGDRGLQWGPLRLTTGVSAGILAVTGLLLLLGIYSHPASWWERQSGAVESGIFWLASVAALSGAFGTLRARTTTALMQSVVVLAAGATGLFGNAGDVLAASTCLVVVGLLGWKLQLRTLQPQTDEDPAPAAQSGASPPVSESSNTAALPETSREEPLLVTATGMLLVLLLGSGIHSAVTIEARPPTRSQNPRALPRPFLRNTTSVDHPQADTPAIDESWLTVGAIGLLAVAAGIAVLPRRRGDSNPDDIPEDTIQVP
jgi:hypothetical protein